MQAAQTKECSNGLQRALRAHFWFRALRTESLAAVVRALRLESLLGDDVVFTQGEADDTFYILERGEVKVTVDGEQQGFIKGPAAFGEMALTHPMGGRPATLTCTEDCRLWSIDRLTFRRTLAVAAAHHTMGRVDFLKKVPLLSKLGSMQISKLADAFATQSYAVGEDIIVQVPGPCARGGRRDASPSAHRACARTAERCPHAPPRLEATDALAGRLCAERSSGDGWTDAPPCGDLTRGASLLSRPRDMSVPSGRVARSAASSACFATAL